MQKDLNTNPTPHSSLVIYWACERHGNTFLVARLDKTCGNDWEWRRQV